MTTGMENKSSGELDALAFMSYAMMDALRKPAMDEVLPWWLAARSLRRLVEVERDRRALLGAGMKL